MNKLRTKDKNNPSSNLDMLSTTRTQIYKNKQVILLSTNLEQSFYQTILLSSFQQTRTINQEEPSCYSILNNEKVFSTIVLFTWKVGLLLPLNK